MNCVNCDYQLNQEDKFCTSCGNKVICERLSNKSLINEFSSKYLSVDSKLWVTIKDMTIRPEKVIKFYINNNRARYLPPVNFMLISALLGGFYSFLLYNGYFGEIDLNFLKSSTPSSESELGINQEELTRTINSGTQKYYSVILFATIPLLALISKLVFHNYKQFNFAEHVIIYAYAYAQFLILSYLTIPFMIWVEGFAYYYTLFSSLVAIGWHAYVLKRVFDLSLKNIVIKTLFFLIVLVTFIVIMIIIGTIIGVMIALMFKVKTT